MLFGPCRTRLSSHATSPTKKWRCSLVQLENKQAARSIVLTLSLRNMVLFFGIHFTASVVFTDLMNSPYAFLRGFVRHTVLEKYLWKCSLDALRWVLHLVSSTRNKPKRKEAPMWANHCAVSHRSLDLSRVPIWYVRSLFLSLFLLLRVACTRQRDIEKCALIMDELLLMCTTSRIDSV